MELVNCEVGVWTIYMSKQVGYIAAQNKTQNFSDLEQQKFIYLSCCMSIMGW